MARKTKPVHLILIGLLVIVWILAIKRMISFTGGSDDKYSTIGDGRNKNVLIAEYKDERSEFDYSHSFRNPFIDPQKYKQVKVLPQEIIKQPPRVNFSVEGIVYKKGHSLVIIKDFSSTTKILAINDRIGEYIITDISRDSVVVMTEDGKYRQAFPVKKR